MSNSASIVRMIAEDFYFGRFDLSARGNEPSSSMWSNLPFVECVQFLRDLETEQRTIAFYITFLAAIDRARNSSRLWWNGMELLDNHAHLFNPIELFNVSTDELAACLEQNKVSSNARQDAEAWLGIAKTIALESNCPVSRLIYGNSVDARKLLKDLTASAPDKKKRFPLLGGNKTAVSWIRMMASSGRANITHVDSVSITVDSHVRRATVNLDMSKKEDLNVSKDAAYIQSIWRSAVELTDFEGPEGIKGTSIALDPALTFFGRHGCGHCEKTKNPVRFGLACNYCNLLR